MNKLLQLTALLSLTLAAPACLSGLGGDSSNLTGSQDCGGSGQVCSVDADCPADEECEDGACQAHGGHGGGDFVVELPRDFGAVVDLFSEGQRNGALGRCRALVAPGRNLGFDEGIEPGPRLSRCKDGGHRIGCDRANGGIGNFFIGDLDDVRLYRRALGPTEIANLASHPP